MKTIKIGRGMENDIVIKSDVVSAKHAIIRVSSSGEVTIEDLNSKNGTYVDGKKVSKATIQASSTVLLGNYAIDLRHIIQTSKDKTPVNIPQDVVEKKTIGRSPSSQIRYSSDDVSGIHAYICKRASGEILLIDNNSTNGTYVNGSRITLPYTLRKGDNVAIANKHPFNWEAVFQPKTTLNVRAIISIAVSVVLIVGIMIFTLWPWNGKDWSDIYAEHKNDVVLIYVKSTYAATIQGRPLSAYLNGYNELDYCTLDENNKVSSGITRGTGTGFFISKDGKFLTNRHVVSCSGNEDENEEIVRRAIQTVLLQNNLNEIAAHVEVNYVTLSVGIAQNDTYIDNENNLLPCTVLRVSDKKELDVAILQTNSKSIPSGSTYVDLSKAVPSDKLTLGDGICTIGFPKSFIIGQTSAGLEANNQSGEITQERGTYEYGHNITIHQGASGSPVYDKKGRFAGIIVSGFLGISQGYNHAIHPTPVIEFVQRAY